MSGPAQGAAMAALGRIAAASAGLSSMFAELSTATYALIAAVEPEEDRTSMDGPHLEPEWESPTRLVTAPEFLGESELRSLFEAVEPDPTLVAMGRGGFPAALMESEVLALVPGAAAGDLALEVAKAMARDDVLTIDALLGEGAAELEQAYGAEAVAAFTRALARFTELDARGAAWRS
jgi:hypothetical protein